MSSSPTTMMSVAQRMLKLRSIHGRLLNQTPRATRQPQHMALGNLVRKAHTLGGTQPGNIPDLPKRPLSEVSPDEEAHEVDDPDDAFEGSNAYRFVIPNQETENFSFDSEVGILQEPEDERRYYEDVVKPKREEEDRQQVLKFGEVTRDIDGHLPQEFEVSSDPFEWAYVERLLPMKIIPHLPPSPSGDGVYPSGFVAPKTQPGELPYHVTRTRNYMLPVYTEFDRPKLLVTTYINNCDGDLYKLRADLKQFLFERYEQEFMTQVAELYGRVKFRGDFEQDFKEFLLHKGF